MATRRTARKVSPSTPGGKESAPSTVRGASDAPARRRSRVASVADLQRDGAFSAAQSDSLVSQAYQNILYRIVRLELEPGQAFSEGDLAAELSLSKTPVREALLMLRCRGFVFPRPRSGYRVTPITMKHVRDLFGLLKLVEPECAALVATRGVDAQRMLMFEDLNLEVDPSDPRSVNDFLDAQVTFRQLLSYESGNERFFLLSDSFAFDLARLLRLTLTLSPLGPEIFGDHERLVAALANGDSARAREIALHRLELLERHITETLLRSEAVQGVNVGARP